MSEGALGCAGCFIFLAVCTGLYVAVGAISAWVIEWAWNLLVPLFFHGPSISYAVACAIYVVLSIIIGLFRGFLGQS